MEAGKGLSCQSVRSLVAPSSRFSVKNGLPLAPLASNNCAHKCGPRLWGVSAAEGLPQTHPAPSAAVCGPTRQEQRARGRDSSSSKEARTTASPSSRQPPQRRRSSPRSLIRNLPEPADMAGGAEIGWEQDISALEEHLQWPEWDPESPRGLWTRMTPNDHTQPGSHLPARRPECSLNAES